MSELDLVSLKSALDVLYASDNPPADSVAAAAALNAQTKTLTNQPFTWGDAKVIALLSPNFSWAKIITRSKETVTLPPVSPVDFAVLAAITAVETDVNQVFVPSAISASTQLATGIGALAAVGDLTPEDCATLATLSTKVVPLWPYALSPDFIASFGYGG